MTAPLGSAYCIRTDLGCVRRRHVSPTGIAYSTCVSHARDLLSRAFASHDVPLSVAPNRLPSAAPRGAERAVMAPAGVPAPVD